MTLTTAAEILVRPLFLFVLLFASILLAGLIRPLIPEGRVKEFLYRRRQLVPDEQPAPWVQWIARAFIALLVALVIRDALIH